MLAQVQSNSCDRSHEDESNPHCSAVQKCRSFTVPA